MPPDDDDDDDEIKWFNGSSQHGNRQEVFTVFRNVAAKM